MSDIRPADSRFPEPPKAERIRLSPPAPVVASKEPVSACDISVVGAALRSPRSFPVASVFFGISAVLLLVLGAALASFHVVLFAILPALLAVAFFLTRPAGFACAVTSDRLEISNPHLNLPYEEIQEIFAPEREGELHSFPIHVLHAHGFVTIAARLNVPSEDVYRFLVNQPLSVAGDRRVPAVLAEFLRVQESLYGQENVWVYKPRSSLPTSGPAQVCVTIGRAGAFTGLIWVGVSSLARDHSGWFAAGLACAIVGVIFAFLCWLVGKTAGGSRIKNWRQACLVLSPGGIALVQANLKGELKWREVLDMKIRKKAAFSVAGDQEMGPGLVFKVEGASIVVADIYQRPLEHIYRLSRQFWETRA